MCHLVAILLSASLKMENSIHLDQINMVDFLRLYILNLMILIGRLGQADQDTLLIPKKIVALKNILIVACGNWHTLALDNLGNVFGTGYNKHGSLGLGDQTNRTSFNMLKDIASKENE